MEEKVVFKGVKDGLLLIMDPVCDFEEIVEQIEQKIAGAGKFFLGANIVVKYRGRSLSPDDKSRLVAILDSRSGAHVMSLEEEMAEPFRASRDKLEMRKYFFNGIEEGNTKFYRGTVRSGQQIVYDGNLVVIGDVNPGGELIATGNVIVMGTLRGTVHGGSDGNREAVVVAFNLQPTQLRIADVITRPPDEKLGRNPVPEMAYIKDDMVYIEAYLPARG